MRTIPELEKALDLATTPADFDKLEAELSQAKRLARLDQNRARLEREQALKNAREKAQQGHQVVLDQINDLYSNQVKSIDDGIFAAVVKLSDLVEERFALTREAFELEQTAAQQAQLLGLKFSYRQPALFGGAPLFSSPARLIKTWLQRLTCWTDKLGRAPTALEIGSHGMADPGTESGDMPDLY